MLASLLPGLRNVRTALTVGYLWLITGWLIWADDILDACIAETGLALEPQPP